MGRPRRENVPSYAAGRLGSGMAMKFDRLMEHLTAVAHVVLRDRVTVEPRERRRR